MMHICRVSLPCSVCAGNLLLQIVPCLMAQAQKRIAKIFLFTADAAHPAAVADAVDHHCGTAPVRPLSQRHEGSWLPCRQCRQCKPLTCVSRSPLVALLSLDVQPETIDSTPLNLQHAQELVDDVRRHRSDSVLNHRLVTVLRTGGEMQARWQDLRVGDVVKV